MSDFRTKLRDSGYRLTPQRELILAGSDRAPTYHTVTDDEHFHLVCRNCRRVVSVDPAMLDQLGAALRTSHGFVVDVGHLTVFGACEECDPR